MLVWEGERGTRTNLLQPGRPGPNFATPWESESFCPGLRCGRVLVGTTSPSALSAALPESSMKLPEAQALRAFAAGAHNRHGAFAETKFGRRVSNFE